MKLLDKEAGDRSGKLYGLGHAVYTMSDPRAVLLKKYAQHMAEIKGYAEDFAPSAEGGGAGHPAGAGAPRSQHPHVRQRGHVLRPGVHHAGHP
ncbi:MAG: citrate/2-methylcitrate synthase [Evtepia sp.]